MTTAVVDTNVLASGLVRARDDSPPVRLLELWLAKRFQLVTSVHIKDELERTLRSRYFLARVSAEVRESLFTDLDQHARTVPLLRSVGHVATHPEDDLVLATALNANADYLVTGDKALLDLGTFEGTRIVSAADFVAILEAS